MMKKDSRAWNSPSMGEKVKVNTYGTSGTPILFFNSDCDKTGNDLKFLDSIRFQLDEGLNMAFTVQKPDYKLIFDESVDPRKRLIHYLHLESFIIDEVVPRMISETGRDFIIVSGVGDGGYLAINMMLKHPTKFHKCITVCGKYDMRPWFDGSEDEDFYYNNPIEFLPNLTDETFLSGLRGSDIRLITHIDDPNTEQADTISDFLHSRQVDHVLDVWGSERSFDAETLKEMYAKHIP